MVRRFDDTRQPNSDGAIVSCLKEEVVHLENKAPSAQTWQCQASINLTSQPYCAGNISSRPKQNGWLDQRANRRDN